ncbi:hypothetical protein [Hypericibacter sp.]|uniref:hypothetical protein n=1 Tax=Hypericibacter sp. TaxID=2705401 RepID=UPI003D6CA702
MSRTLDDVYAVIARMPGDDGEKSRLRETARRYHRACGCALSGVFLIVAILACVACLILAEPFRLSLIALGLAGIFGAGLLGKAIGIGWARVRLALMHRSLVRRLAT